MYSPCQINKVFHCYNALSNTSRASATFKVLRRKLLKVAMFSTSYNNLFICAPIDSLSVIILVAMNSFCFIYKLLGAFLFLSCTGYITTNRATPPFQMNPNLLFKRPMLPANNSYLSIVTFVFNRTVIIATAMNFTKTSNDFFLC